MQSSHPVANPFGLMINPQAVVQAMEASQRLRGLHSRVCRPLDKPLIPGQSAEAADTAEGPEEPEGLDAEADSTPGDAGI